MRELELHAHAKQVQRSKGRSSVAAAAYRAGVCLYDDRTGLTHDYTRKQGVEFSRVYLPDNAPQALHDREALWNAVEKKENRSNSCTAHEIEVGFPAEFNAMQRREAGDKIARELMNRYGCAVDIAYHKPSRDGDQRNYHAHILFTSRAFDRNTKDGWAKTKFRDLAHDKCTHEGVETTRGELEVLSLREFIAGEMNRISMRDKLDVHTHHLSFEKRDIDREPTEHVGPVASEMEQKGKESDKGSNNREIEHRNQERAMSHSNVIQVNFSNQTWLSHARVMEKRITLERRHEDEREKLGTELDRFYGRHLKTVDREIKAIEARLRSRGLKRIFRNATGLLNRDLKNLKLLKKTQQSAQKRIGEVKGRLDRRQRLEAVLFRNQYEPDKPKVSLRSTMRPLPPGQQLKRRGRSRYMVEAKEKAKPKNTPDPRQSTTINRRDGSFAHNVDPPKGKGNTRSSFERSTTLKRSNDNEKRPTARRRKPDDPGHEH